MSDSFVMAAQPQIFTQGSTLHAVEPGRTCYSQHFAGWKCEKTSIALIVCLLQWRGPAAIVFLVMTICFDSIESLARRSFAHISQKSCKRIAPLGTHANSATAIYWILLIFWIVTTRFRVIPRFIGPTLLWLAGLISCVTVIFTSKTSATFGISTPERASAHNVLFSTIAFTSPSKTSPCVLANSFNCNETSESLP